MLRGLRRRRTIKGSGWVAGLKMAVSTFACGLCVGTACGFELITAQEATYPDDSAGRRRAGLTRGPEVIFVAPPPTAGLVASPLNLKIRFKTRGGSEIDRNSVVITYTKIPAIDVTQRLIPFISNDGIDAKDAELPPGMHRFRIDVKDVDGRSTTAYLLIRVAK
jgi:hypothetical protein